MPGPFQFFAPLLRRIFAPIFRPLTRTLATVVAIPLFRWFIRKVLRVNQLDEETEKDLSEWFKGSVLLLFCTRNFENIFVKWYDPTIADVQLVTDGSLNWFVTGGRLLIAIAAVETMPDQQLFAIIHPGPPKLTYNRAETLKANIARQWKPFAIGLACQHLNRSSPVLAIMSVIMQGTVGWVCFVLAIAQYLIIGLVTSRDRAIDVLMRFDERVEEKRAAIIEEFHIGPDDTNRPLKASMQSTQRSAMQSAQPVRTDPVEHF